jgi:uncharacterized membrane protein YadS
VKVNKKGAEEEKFTMVILVHLPATTLSIRVRVGFRLDDQGQDNCDQGVTWDVHLVPCPCLQRGTTFLGIKMKSRQIDQGGVALLLRQCSSAAMGKVRQGRL